MTNENRQKLIERHDALVGQFEDETDDQRASELLEKIAAIEFILVNSAPISEAAEYQDN